jgi:hypothetical protein
MWAPQITIDASKITPEMVEKIRALGRSTARAVIFDSMDPDTATGEALEALAALTGTVREVHGEDCVARTTGNPIDCGCGV